MWIGNWKTKPDAPEQLSPPSIAPNVPIFVCLVDPEGQYDMDLRQGVYQTTTGDLLVLPRPAVIALNMCEPRPGEEVVIQKHWSGKTGDSPQWTVALSTRSELSRASEATDSQDLTEQLERSIQALKLVHPYLFDGTEMSYGLAFGSNGERDFMRSIVRTALTKARLARGESPKNAK
jgi:hypothetical protein